MKAWKHLLVFLLVFIFFVSKSYAQKNSVENQIPYQVILEKISLILERMELYQSINEKKFEQIDKRFEQIDKRFEQVDKRFEQIDKRFEQIDKRFEQVDKRFNLLVEANKQLREDMNKANNQLREDMNKQFNLLVEANKQLREDMNNANNQLREDMNKRFEQVDRRFEFILQIYLALLAFTVGTPFIIEMRRKRKEQKIEAEIRKEVRENKKEIQENKKEMKIVVAAIQELAKVDENIRNALKKIDQKGIFFNPHPVYA